MNTQLIADVSAFLWQEADMLDHGEYAEWLNLWTNDGLYIVPIDETATDLEDRLNYAYDNADMRAKRVQRLTSGESISTIPASKVVRTVSRLRVLSDEAGVITVRAAQVLREFHREAAREYGANITVELVRDGASFKIKRKIVRLINSTDVLHAIAYIP